MNKFTVHFEFQFNSKTWYWEKTFHSTSEEINQRITNYIQQKKLPFDLDSKIIKYKFK